MTQSSGRVAFITGGSKGIGAATALRFGKQGARVVIADVDSDAGPGVADAINAQGGEALFVRCDVSSEADMKAAIDETVRRFGRLDIAFNNAGWEGAMGPLHTCVPADVDRLFAINLRGVFLGMKYQVAQMLAQGGGGAIVNNSSIAGLKGLANASIYAASKHGVIGMTKCAALDYATQGIRINAVCPGVIDTPMIHRAAHGDPATLEAFTNMQPIKRMGKPEEIATVVTWLCSDEASFVTGATIEADGGIMAG
jgi:NAD(P)-dependent dehydrogenase (short-subunit alcohol dehydrogenase family)